MNNDINNTELNIRIDRVVLDGISLTSYEQQRLKESVERELTGMFLTNGIPPGIEKAPVRIKGDAIQLQEQKPAPDRLGKQVAESIYNGLASEQGNK
jgi:hypothetical protein